MQGDRRDLQQPTEDETKTKTKQELRLSGSFVTAVVLPALAPDSPLRFRQEVLYAITFGSQPDYASPFLHTTKCTQAAVRFHGARCVVKPCRLPR
jgi:hypothetical protein